MNRGVVEDFNLPEVCWKYNAAEMKQSGSIYQKQLGLFWHILTLSFSGIYIYCRENYLCYKFIVLKKASRQTFHSHPCCISHILLDVYLLCGKM